jgi:hypothetical protein
VSHAANSKTDQAISVSLLVVLKGSTGVRQKICVSQLDKLVVQSPVITTILVKQGNHVTVLIVPMVEQTMQIGVLSQMVYR